MPLVTPRSPGGGTGDINIGFYADDNITPVVENIKKGLGGLQGEDGGGSFMEKLSEGFNEALFNISNLRNTIGMIGDVIKFATKQLDELVKLSEDRPELFSASELQAVQEYGEAVNTAKDAWIGFKISASDNVLPDLTDSIRELTVDLFHHNEFLEIRNRLMDEGVDAEEARIQAVDTIINSLNAATVAGDSYDQSIIRIGQNTEYTKETEKELTKARKDGEKAVKERADAEEEAIKRMTKANQEYLDDIGYWSDQYEKKAETAASIAEARADIEADLAKARADGWQEGSDKIQGYLDKLSDLDKKEQEAAENWEENIAKRKLAMLEELLSADGELTEAELQSLEEKGVAWGVYTEEAIAQEQALRAEVQGLANDIMGIPDRTINIEVNATGSGLALIGGEGETKAKVGVKGKKAAGGPVSGGDSYLVGEQGPELFTPGASGQITSNANLGGIDEKRLARLITAAMLKGLAQQ